MLSESQLQKLDKAFDGFLTEERPPQPRKIIDSFARSMMLRYGKRVRNLLTQGPRNGLWSIDLGCGGSDKYQPHWCRGMHRLQETLDCTEARTVGIDIGTMQSEPFESHQHTDLVNDAQALRRFEPNSWDLITTFQFIGASEESPTTTPALTQLSSQRFRKLIIDTHANVQRLLRDGGLFLWQREMELCAVRKRKGLLEWEP